MGKQIIAVGSLVTVAICLGLFGGYISDQYRQTHSLTEMPHKVAVNANQSASTQLTGNTLELHDSSQTTHTANSVSNGTVTTLSNGSQKSATLPHSPQASSSVSKEASTQTLGASSQIVHEEHQALGTLNMILIDMTYETAMNNQANGLQTNIQKLEFIRNRVQSWHVSSATDYGVKSVMLSAISDLEQSANYTIKALGSGAPNASASDAAQNYLTSASNEMNLAVSDIANGTP